MAEENEEGKSLLMEGGETPPTDAKEEGSLLLDGVKAPDFSSYKGLKVGDKEVGDTELSVFAPVVDKLGVGKEGAQELLNAFSSLNQNALQAQELAVKEEVKKWRDSARTHEVLADGNFEGNLSAAKEVLMSNFSKEAIELLDRSQLLNHPEVIAGFFNASKALAEGVKEKPMVAGVPASRKQVVDSNKPKDFISAYMAYKGD